MGTPKFRMTSIFEFIFKKLRSKILGKFFNFYIKNYVLKFPTNPFLITSQPSFTENIFEKLNFLINNLNVKIFKALNFNSNLLKI